MMDSQRFDSLTKQMATRVTRRRVAKTMLGGAVVSALTQFGSRSSAAQSVGHCCAELCRNQGKFTRFCIQPCHSRPSEFGCGE